MCLIFQIIVLSQFPVLNSLPPVSDLNSHMAPVTGCDQLRHKLLNIIQKVSLHLSQQKDLARPTDS